MTDPSVHRAMSMHAAMTAALTSCLTVHLCLQVALDRVMLRNLGPGKDLLQLGATASCEIPTGDVLIGSGDGTLVVLKTAQEPSANNPKVLKKMSQLAKLKLEGAVTSVVLDEVVGRTCVFFVGTAACNIYRVSYEPTSSKFVEELVQTAHSEKINSLTFPAEYSEVFATCGVGYIRVWHLQSCRELLRISVPNLEAHCVTFSMVSLGGLEARRHLGGTAGSECAAAVKPRRCSSYFWPLQRRLQ